MIIVADMLMAGEFGFIVDFLMKLKLSVVVMEKQVERWISKRRCDGGRGGLWSMEGDIVEGGRQ